MSDKFDGIATLLVGAIYDKGKAALTEAFATTLRERVKKAQGATDPTISLTLRNRAIDHLDQAKLAAAAGNLDLAQHHIANAIGFLTSPEDPSDQP